MQTTRQILLILATFGLACMAASAAGLPKTSTPPASTVDDLVRRNAAGNAALMRGDMRTYVRLLPLASDFTLMSPMGGEVGRAPYSPEAIEDIGKFFRNGTFDQELVQSYATRDMVVLATVERAQVEVGGLPPQEWLLRVTVVFRRSGSRWELVHRHADPLAKGISVAQAAALARGAPNRALASGAVE